MLKLVARAKEDTNKVKLFVDVMTNAYLQSVISTFGTDYWNTWYGVIAVPDYATPLQFGLGGAIYFDFPKKK